ncbi:MAG: putative beta-lysine N-acetyltransferase [Candidatus Marinimicrobia bacterium CG1_02_48_14]|nr:MAG: putative beta-lysine N-acetyltransferase [Candidatus Marinimicrobia bacterium CG1_02_48_14]
MPDSIDTLRHSKIQHGAENDRIYLMHLDPRALPEILSDLDLLAEKNRYGKIFAKVPDPFTREFQTQGYRIEARVPGFFKGETPAAFLAKYFKTERQLEPKADLAEQVLAAARLKADSADVNKVPFNFRLAEVNDAMEIADVYREVFKTYPFPIHNPRYIAKTMQENFLYFTLWENESLVAVASCEMDYSEKNVEMTDFATRPKYRGQGTAVYLLERMDQMMPQHGMKTAFTIARSYSFGMNITFAKLGYEYGGTLTQNTNIAGSLESMNVWYKPLPDLVSSLGRDVITKTQLNLSYT